MIRLCKLLLGILLLACLAGCANPGIPLPPSLELAQPPNDLTAVRKGNHVFLAWTPPAATTDHGPFRHPGITRVCRVVGEFPMSSCRQLVKELPPPQASTGRTPQVVFEDVLPEVVNADLSRITYAVEVMNQRGRSAGLSNQVLVPLAPVLPPPSDLKCEVVPEGIRLSFHGVAAANLPRTPMGVSFHYTIWRRLQGKGEFSALPQTAIAAPEVAVVDNTIDWEQTYEYKTTSVTTVTAAGRAPEQFEGDDSAIVKVFAHDVFPPAQPAGLQAVFSGVGQQPAIDLTWEPNLEPDLAGYDVFRRVPGEAQQKLNSELLKVPSFRDLQVAPGITYTYSIQAVDLRGNRSPRSAEAGESVPK